MTDDDLRTLLQAACDKAGSQAAWAKAHGLRAQLVSDVLCARREPTAKLARALGLEPVPPQPVQRQWVMA
jgi:phosphohistidine phosphatase SixA